MTQNFRPDQTENQKNKYCDSSILKYNIIFKIMNDTKQNNYLHSNVISDENNLEHLGYRQNQNSLNKEQAF